MQRSNSNKIGVVVTISSFVMGRYDVEDMVMKTKKKKIFATVFNCNESFAKI